MEMKSAAAKICLSSNRSDGTSTIAPSRSVSGRGKTDALGALKLAGDLRARRLEFRHLAYHRQEQPQGAAVRRSEQRPDLVAEQGRPVERDTQGTPAKRRIFFADRPAIAGNLVAAQIERSKNDRLASGRVQHLLVKGDLIGKPRHVRADHELQLRAEQPDAVGARLVQMRQIEQKACVHVQADLDPVARHRRFIANGGKLRDALRQQRLLGLEGVTTSGSGRRRISPVSESTTTRSPGRAASEMSSTPPTSGMPSERATIAMCDVCEASSTTSAVSRLRP
jgi:hypothetical protein